MGLTLQTISHLPWTTEWTYKKHSKEFLEKVVEVLNSGKGRVLSHEDPLIKVYELYQYHLPHIKDYRLFSHFRQNFSVILFITPE